MTYRALRDRAAGVLDSRLEAELLLSSAFGRERAWLFAHLDDAVGDAESLQRLETWVSARQAGQPVAYLLGQREFYGREFLVTPDVLIPRPETELLIDLALGLDLSADCTVVDIGTGSGCIALTLAAERTRWQVLASDVSASALTVANNNRVKLGLEPVGLFEGSLYEPFAGRRFDLIVSNPPYVAVGDPHLDLGDVRFEPEIALSSGEDGLATIRALVEQAHCFLKPGGWLLLEHGYDQGPAVVALLERAGFIDAACCQDLAGIDRVSMGRMAD
jgi:release factor glutamine methyltransferase